MKDRVYENTPIGDLRKVSLKSIRELASDIDYIADYDWIVVIHENKQYVFNEESEIKDLRKCLRQSGIQAVVWEIAIGESCFFGDPDSLIYETPESETTFTLSELLKMPESDPRFADPYFFSEYSNT